MLVPVAKDLDLTMDQRLDEHASDVERLRAGDQTALEDLLEACTGAKVSSVTVRTLV
jgi:hypothetical protein